MEVLGTDVMDKLMGQKRNASTDVVQFFGRIFDAVQLCNDERVQTKENMKRTCMLNTEYVGVVDFKLEDGDFEFLWRKVGQ